MRTPALLLLPLLCIWDSDTLATELRGIPEPYHLVIGRWHRHGEAYYRKRIETLPAQLDKNPDDLAAYDDLGVAYDRLKEYDKGIEVMRRKAEALKRRPDADQEYRGLSNLGTFHAHAGRLDEALAWLEKAIALNPNAHFGRERFQIDAYKYLSAAKKDSTLWARHNFLSWSGCAVDGHRRGMFEPSYSEPFMSDARGRPVPTKTVPWDEAYTAVAGMIRFGGAERPEYYRVLGDLYLQRMDLNLAWISFHRAVERDHPAKKELLATIEKIEKHWRGAETDVAKEEDYQKARRVADSWVASFERLETEAIKAGKDTSREEVLAELVAGADREAGKQPMVSSGGMFFAKFGLPEKFLSMCAAAIAGILGIMLLRWARRRRLAA